MSQILRVDARYRFRHLLLCTGIFLAAAACGDDDDNGGSQTGNGQTGGGAGTGGTQAPACGSPGRTGETTCMASPNGQCPAGQYCDSSFLTCTAGCTSDANCAHNERCVRNSGEAVGACEPCPTNGSSGGGNNDGLNECFEVCESFEFFCDAVNGERCASACVGADSQKRASFVGCADPVNCNTYSCVSRLD